MAILAERFARAGNYRKSVECATKALAIYRNAMSAGQLQLSNAQARPLTRDFHSTDRQLNSSLGEFATGVAEHLGQIYTHVDLILQGINLSSYRRFQALTPIVHLSKTKMISPIWGPGSPANPSKEDAEFCINFVVDVALQGGKEPTP